MRNVDGKENLIVFPHRLDGEKHPEVFDELARNLKKELPGWWFVKTKDVCKTKEDYYSLLGRAKIAVSCATQETFGYAMLEAAANGCYPITPDALSYAEMPIYNGWRYKTYEEMVAKSMDAVGQTEPFADPDGSKYSTEKVLARIFGL